MGLDTDKAEASPATHGVPPPNQGIARQSGLQRDKEGRLYREVSADQLMALVESPFAP